MRLIHPVNPDYVRISQEWRVFPRHSGRDYRYISDPHLIPESKEVRAAAPGKVVGVYSKGLYNRGYGNQVMIQHTSEIWTTYNHLLTGSVKVKVGDTVKAGQLLGTMGATGKTRPVGAIHLHFEVRKGGSTENKRVNPAYYFQHDLPGTPTVITGSPSGGEKFPRASITTAALNIRPAANTSGKVITSIPKNTRVATGLVKGDWVRVKFTKRGKTYYGWVNRSYVTDVFRTTNTPKSKLNLRATSSAKSKVIASIPNGTDLAIKAFSGPGATDSLKDNPRAKVTYKGKTGWVSRAYLK